MSGLARLLLENVRNKRTSIEDNTTAAGGTIPSSNSTTESRNYTESIPRNNSRKRSFSDDSGESDVGNATNNKNIFTDGYHYQLQRLQGELIGKLYNSSQLSGRNSYYFSTSIFATQLDDIKKIITNFEERKKHVFIWCIKHEQPGNDHYHIVHDCMWSNKSCRCFRYNIGRRKFYELYQIKQLSKESWENIVKYHFQDGRDVQYCYIGAKNYTQLFNRLENIRELEYNSGGEMDGCERNVEISDSEDEVLGKQVPISSNINNDNGFSQENTSRNRKRQSRVKRSTEEKTQEKLEKFIVEICRVPLKDFTVVDQFLNSDFRFLNLLSSPFKNAIVTIENRFKTFLLRDYIYFYKSRSTLPYWDTHSKEDFNSHYIMLHTSKEILYKLLIWQYAAESLDNNYEIINDNWKSNVYKYMKDLILFLDRKKGKENTQVYISAPNAGKTLFMDLIRDFMVSCGYMSHWNRTSNFPLQTCGNSRIIFWNEPNYDTAIERNLLKLLGGDSLNAAQKNMTDAIITKTPVFVTSNNKPFPNKPEFDYRISYHNWKSFEYLKIVGSKKLHPLSFLYLIEETENYYEDDITQFNEKYTIINEVEYLDQINYYKKLNL